MNFFSTLILLPYTHINLRRILDLVTMKKIILTLGTRYSIGGEFYVNKIFYLLACVLVILRTNNDRLGTNSSTRVERISINTSSTGTRGMTSLLLSTNAYFYAYVRFDDFQVGTKVQGRTRLWQFEVSWCKFHSVRIIRWRYERTADSFLRVKWYVDIRSWLQWWWKVGV